MHLEHGEMVAQFVGWTPHAQAIEKIAQMCRDLNHIQNALNGVERAAVRWRLGRALFESAVTNTTAHVPERRIKRKMVLKPLGGSSGG